MLIDKNTRVLIQGITGKAGSFHTKQMLAFGTKVVAGVRPGKEGCRVHGVTVFDSVRKAVKATGASASCVFVPAQFAYDAIMESIESELELIVVITEGIPVWDMMRIRKKLKSCRSLLIGPNCPGITSVDECKIGIIPGNIHKKGKVAVLSRSGTLTYDAVYQLTQAGIGQSVCIGIGGDAVLGTSFVDCLRMIEKDANTDAVLIIGEIGGLEEEEAAKFIKKHLSKPAFAYIAGLFAPEEKRMGHAGAVISGKSGRADYKISALRASGVKIIQSPALISQALKKFKQIDF